ncbi:hypothetical protein [Rhodococcus koreensis]
MPTIQPQHTAGTEERRRPRRISARTQHHRRVSLYRLLAPIWAMGLRVDAGAVLFGGVGPGS